MSMQDNVPIYLITRWLSGEATIEEKETLKIWLQQSPENRALFIEHETLWVNVRANEKFKSDRGLEKINQRIDTYEKLQRQPARVAHFYLYKVAASFIAIGLAAALPTPIIQRRN